VIFGTEVGLDSLAVRGPALVNVLAGFVAADEADGFDPGLVDDEVHCAVGAVDYVDHTVRESGFL
jgi:hypothetical protein